MPSGYWQKLFNLVKLPLGNHGYLHRNRLLLRTIPLRQRYPFLFKCQKLVSADPRVKFLYPKFYVINPSSYLVMTALLAKARESAALAGKAGLPLAGKMSPGEFAPPKGHFQARHALFIKTHNGMCQRLHARRIPRRTGHCNSRQS